MLEFQQTFSFGALRRGMDRRTFIVLLVGAIIPLVVSVEAAAQPANSNAGGNGNGNAGGNGNGNADGASGSNAGGNGNGAGGGNGHGGGDASSNAGGDGNGNGGPSGPANAHPSVPDQDVARQAVESGAARPLADIIETARKTYPGDVLDARLVTVKGFLLYELKVLEGQVVRKVYFYARSGLPVRGR